MRRFTILIALAICISSPASAAESKGSGLLSSSALVYTGTGAITQVFIKTDGTNDAVAVLYDNTSAAGTVITSFTCAGTEKRCAQDWSGDGRALTKGIYLSLSGTGAEAIVEYVPR